MKVIVPSYHRARSISTHRAFQPHPVVVLVHDDAERAAYLARGDLAPKSVVVSGVEPGPGGVMRQRRWAIANLVDPGEWFVFADDNIRALTAVPPPFYAEPSLPVGDGRGAFWRQLYGQVVDGPSFLAAVVPDCLDQAARQGAHLVGFGTTANPFFRGQKWITAGYVTTKLCLWHNHEPDFPWDDSIGMDDFYYTATRLLRDGVVLVNRYAYPVAGHYEPGGIGTYTQRLPQVLMDVHELQRRFPGLFRPVQKAGFVRDSDLALRLHSPAQIARWRQQMAARV